MTKQMIAYCDNAGIAYSVADTWFRVKVVGEEYTFRRLGLRRWDCKHNGVLRVFRSQSEVIDWLDSRW